MIGSLQTKARLHNQNHTHAFPFYDFLQWDVLHVSKRNATLKLPKLIILDPYQYLWWHVSWSPMDAFQNRPERRKGTSWAAVDEFLSPRFGTKRIERMILWMHIYIIGRTKPVCKPRLNWSHWTEPCLAPRFPESSSPHGWSGPAWWLKAGL